MININNKSWEKLRFSDIKKLLSGADDETFFFEYKADDTSPKKLVKEISAFANTYGGYILLGVNDDKTIGGCEKWTEQKIHVTIHDSITPVPNFDIKKFKHNDKTIFVIKIEEGGMPPYITNEGKIFERVSSGSFPIKDSSKLSQLFYKSENQIKRIKNKIELEDIVMDTNSPNNICGYLDLGFSVVCSEKTELEKNFYTMNFDLIAEHIRRSNNEFSISRLGTSYVISVGKMSATDRYGNELMINAGINDYIEIMCDGSVKCRVILTNRQGDSKVDIARINFMHNIFSEIYSMIFGRNFAKIFIYAYKYERLTVLKQFIPYYKKGSENTQEEEKEFEQYLINHINKYGNNLIVNSNRFPKNDFIMIDKNFFSKYKIKYNIENLVSMLFYSEHNNLGYIDEL